MLASARHLLIALLLPLLVACETPQEKPTKDTLAEVLERGEIRVLTRNAATTYYEGADGPTGMEYDLARGFADELGVQLRVITVENVADILNRLEKGDADFAAAGLTVTEARKARVRFGPPYQEITQQLVYRQGTPRPSGLDALDGTLEVMSGSSHAERLREAKERHPELTWTENADAGSEELLNLVAERLIDYTIADSNELRINRRYIPELRVALDVSRPQQLAWAFPRHESKDTLYEAAVLYFGKIRQSGRLAQLWERHYGHVDRLNYVGTRYFQRQVKQRLPRYENLFREAAERYELDWRLLAAMAYQESHWRPNAVSPTGVRGLMMLTRNTASQVGIKDRTDPVQSIYGGAKYIRALLRMVPERIQGRDRLWLAVAAYNIGYGHLEDARIITQKMRGNPDRWMDVKKHLPLLRKKSWYSKTRHGYARGDEALQYVENIRSYYDILVWLTEQERPAPPEPPRALTIASPAL